MSWSVGFTLDGEDDTVFADNVSFRKGMNILYQNALTNANKAQDSELNDEWLILVSDIKDILGDEGIMGDPDQWEDEDFYGPEVTYWIVEN